MEYYIQGNAANADKIKAAFEKLGYHAGSWDYGDELFFFFSMNNGYIRAQRFPASNKDYEACLIDIIKTHPDYQELELPKPYYDIANFYTGMPVLVREYDTCVWQWVQYSHFNGVGLFFAAGKTWRQCIPFNKDTEHLLGTTDMPSEEYINW